MTFLEFIWQCFILFIGYYWYILIVPVVIEIAINKKSRIVIKKWFKKQIYFLTLVLTDSIIKISNSVHYEA